LNAAGEGPPDYAEAARRFWSDGYVVFDAFYPREVAAAAHEWLTSTGEGAPAWTDATTSESIETDLDIHIALPQAMSPSIQRVHGDERFLALTNAILGEGFADLYGILFRFKGPGVGGPWHQDCSSEIGEPYCVNRLVYSHDAGDAVGGELVVVPGSHKVGRIPPGEQHVSLPRERTITPRAGTVVMLHASTFHRVAAVRSTVPRFSINLRAAPQGTSDTVTNTAVYRNVVCLFDQGRELPRPAP
jgi:ectoine hydroxylase